VEPAAEAAPEDRISGKMKDERQAPAETGSDVMVWLADAERELKKIPFFVRGKAKRNTEKYAAERGVSEISIDTLYEAKAHFAR
jgi:light-independent protochlorophyllide reductase subunit B